MLNRFIASGIVCAAMLAGAGTAHAQQQTVNFTIGYFAPHGEDARTAGDVLVANRNFLVFNINDFDTASVGGEWLFPVGGFLEGGIGLSFSRRTVPTFYRDYFANDGTEIVSDMKLRTVPTTFSVRLLPLGHHNGFQPYIGAGLAVIAWRYSETGDFIDFNNNNAVFRDSFVNTGADVGPVVLGGIRGASRTFSAGFEIRYQSAEGTLDNSFSGPKIDLGGWTYNGTFGFRF
ncbi:MAG TPA: hypothetical protein VGF24_32275 [Vicinamibacterales bacterium]|jgi:hypothetical protein